MRAKKILESWGFTVMRSAKSGGPVDLVAWDDKKMLLVQVKLSPHGEVPLYGKARKELLSFPVPPNCERQLWVAERRAGFHYFPVS